MTYCPIPALRAASSIPSSMRPKFLPVHSSISLRYRRFSCLRRQAMGTRFVSGIGLRPGDFRGRSRVAAFVCVVIEFLGFQHTISVNTNQWGRCEFRN